MRCILIYDVRYIVHQIEPLIHTQIRTRFNVPNIVMNDLTLLWFGERLMELRILPVVYEKFNADNITLDILYAINRLSPELDKELFRSVPIFQSVIPEGCNEAVIKLINSDLYLFFEV